MNSFKQRHQIQVLFWLQGRVQVVKRFGDMDVGNMMYLTIGLLAGSIGTAILMTMCMQQSKRSARTTTTRMINPRGSAGRICVRRAMLGMSDAAGAYSWFGPQLVMSISFALFFSRRAYPQALSTMYFSGRTRQYKIHRQTA